MKSKILLNLILVLGLITIGAASINAADEATSAATETHGWTFPDCDRVKGTKVVTFTTDEGLTLAETSIQRRPVYTEGLVALNLPNTLLASRWMDEEAVLMLSEDAGCQWNRIGSITGCGSLKLVAGPGDTVYAWTRKRPEFYRIEGKDVISLTAPEPIIGLAVNPQSALNLRIGDPDCQLYESQDGGVTFAPIGDAATWSPPSSFTVEFSPSNWDRALCGSIGAWRTTDAGQNWAEVPPFDKTDVDAVQCFVYSKTNDQIVWARANLETLTDPFAEILVSEDGGASFTLLIKENIMVPDQNGELRKLALPSYPAMATHPNNPGLLYFACGGNHDDYGTNFFRYEIMEDNLSLIHIDGLDDINSIAFNPDYPSVMYFGLEESLEKLDEAKTAAANMAEGSGVRVAPNPFNPTANIALSLAQPARVKIDVYNLTGQKVGTVVDANLSVGEHAYRWDGSDFASGIYLLRVQAGSDVQTRKLVLLK
ncbi:MAG: T9SS type A sorting domain-containing protein [Candidatus Zixiibacteriota bacterium]|nr:MAG: T9SS type A sorting domain-containing protein [candidate division Zixibacteria bacterium]